MRERREYRITLKRQGDIAAYLEVKRRLKAETNAEAIRELIKTWKKENARKNPAQLQRYSLDRCRGCSSLTLGCTFDGYCLWRE